MPRGVEARPIVKVSKNMLYDIPFELVVNGIVLAPVAGSVLTVTAEFDNTIKFQAVLVDVSGVWTMEAANVFDAVGDWDAVVQIEEDSGQIVYFSEWFIFRVQESEGGV